MKEAQKLAGKGQFDKAIAEWRKLVKVDPNDAHVFNTIGDLCLKKNAKAEAVDAYRRAADILAEDGFTSKAIALYKKVLNIDPSKIEVHLALGDMNAEKGLTGNALENYKVVADHYKKQNNTAKALGIYQKMADLNSTNVAFRVKLAGMYAKEHMVPEAVKAYLDAADVHVEKSEFQDARQMFEKVLELDPQNSAVYHKAGIVYFKEGKIDEARRSLKRAVEAGPENDELQNLYLEVLEKAGRAGDAEDLYRRQLAADPSRIDLREKLYEIVLSKKDYDRALTEAMALAENKAEGMDFTGAAELLKKLMAVTHDPPAVASALAGFFEKHGRSQDGARELTIAAEILIERGSPDDAREVLSRALILSPGFEDALSKLAAIGGPAAHAAAEIAPDLGAPEAEEIVPPTLEEPAPPPPPSEAPPSMTAPRRPAEEAEDPAVASVIAEADVLMKYGLGERAIDQLEAVMRSHPGHLRLRARLLELYRGQKQNDKAVLQALMLAELYEQRGQHDESQDVLRAALELAPGNAQIMAKLGMEPAAEAVETVEEPEALETLGAETFEEVPELEVPDLELDEPQRVEEDLQAPEVPEEVAEPAAAEETSGGEPALEEVAEFDVAVTEEPPAFTVGQRTAPEAPKPLEQEEVFEKADREPLDESDLMEVWAEAEFYFQQGLFDEARKHYEKYLDQRPGDRKAMERIVEISREKDEVAEFSRLAETVEGLGSLIGTTAETGERVTETDVDSVRSLMEQISIMRKGTPAEPEAKKPAPPPMQKTPLTARPPVPEEEEETSFAGVAKELSRMEPSRPEPEEETSFAGIAGNGADLEASAAGDDKAASDFFDLAAELRDELSATAPKKPAAASEQSLDEIFDEFKKGVEAHEKQEDEDTHYNLGIAYREMGLLDDAIAEFNLTTEGEAKFIQSRYLLGLCYLEKGDFETAITEIQNALGYSYSFGEAGDERIGMHYDLGLAYQGTGNTRGALEEFQKVSNLDPSYKEVFAKIQDLQEGDFISLESIKEDIEKEVSFKFLEEGARIDREEKTKKTKN